MIAKAWGGVVAGQSFCFHSGALAAAAGASPLKGLPRSDDVPAPVATRPYKVVEFDGHRLDVRLKVAVRDPQGFGHEFEIERVWLLLIIDVCTRVVLGSTSSSVMRKMSLSEVLRPQLESTADSSTGFSTGRSRCMPTDGYTASMRSLLMPA